MKAKENASAEAPEGMVLDDRIKAKIGTGLTTVVALFLVFDGITKVIRVPPVIEACQKMGISPNTTVVIGLLLLTCTAIHLLRRTAVLGAVLLTGYLGGAVSTHVVHQSGAFPPAFAVATGMLVWAGLGLREPRLVGWLFLRQ